MKWTRIKSDQCLPMNDSYFRVELLSRTLDPQTLIWQAMHQDYSELLVADEETPSEAKAGEIAIKRLLAGGRGHFGVLEHPSITFSVGYFISNEYRYSNESKELILSSCTKVHSFLGCLI